ncbi:uncharacterized protein [Diadema antillarum]|uniref:uncharacterized protein n=1 Tax=Diadema antillarum TaxID=105358 RepID=UPI003A88351D
MSHRRKGVAAKIHRNDELDLDLELYDVQIAKEAEVLDATTDSEVTESEANVDVPDEDESVMSRRSKRLTTKITDEAVEDDLVEWLRENPILWDSTQRDFRQAEKKERMWTIKAKELNRSGNSLKGWYKNLRDQFVKLKKDKMGDAGRRFTYREQWVLEHFEFLAHTVILRKNKPYGTRRVAITEMMESGGMEQAKHITTIDRESINSVDDPMPSPSRKGVAKKRKRAESPSLVEVTRQLSTAQTQVLQLQQQLMEPVDKRTSYLEYFKSVVKDISEEEWEEFHKISVELEFEWRRNARQRSSRNVINSILVAADP